MFTVLFVVKEIILQSTRPEQCVDLKITQYILFEHGGVTRPGATQDHVKIDDYRLFLAAIDCPGYEANAVRWALVPRIDQALILKQPAKKQTETASQSCFTRF